MGTVHPVIKASLPSQVPESYYDWDRMETPGFTMRVGPELQLGADVYNLAPSSSFKAYQNVDIAEIDVLHTYDHEGPDSLYPEGLKEQPVVFAGKVIIDHEIRSAAGVLFRSGYRLGWVNIQTTN